GPRCPPLFSSPLAGAPGTTTGGGFRHLSLAAAGGLIDDNLVLLPLRLHDEVRGGVPGLPLAAPLPVGGEGLVDPVLDAQDLLGLDRDIRGLALRASPRLMNEDA